ncbi:TerB family tellurite resistance protein [Ferrimonas balearica]|uniref:TerB family tellurite resistance protein n=1 Tax=Ferrimonas balearica TaxID=44012 RepID=UPI001C98E560|nr:TerB family tellurite resistance protein [Ferrimonas balearica]MBY5991124.1 TerB family tellurite resistance protein [Ferrimonas balearica]
MHIILGILGTVVTILVLLNRLQENGVDIGWLNPFSWHRRRRYRVHHDLSPAFKLDSPMDVAALYMVCVAKVDGDMSKEQKSTILSLFESEFHLSATQARELLSASVHLLNQTRDVYRSPQKVIERCYDKVSPAQSQSIGKLIDEVAHAEGEPSSAQAQLVASIKKACPNPDRNKWNH